MPPCVEEPKPLPCLARVLPGVACSRPQAALLYATAVFHNTQKVAPPPPHFPSDAAHSEVRVSGPHPTPDSPSRAANAAFWLLL